MNINLERVFWAFWQSSYCYDYNNGFVCMFDVTIKHLNSQGTPIVANGKPKSEDFYYCGSFSLYKTFVMKNGKQAIDNTKPLISFFTKQSCIETNENQFKIDGIETCYIKWDTEQNAKAT